MIKSEHNRKINLKCWQDIEIFDMARLTLSSAMCLSVCLNDSFLSFNFSINSRPKSWLRSKKNEKAIPWYQYDVADRLVSDFEMIASRSYRHVRDKRCWAVATFFNKLAFDPSHCSLEINFTPPVAVVTHATQVF